MLFSDCHFFCVGFSSPDAHHLAKVAMGVLSETAIMLVHLPSVGIVVYHAYFIVHFCDQAKGTHASINLVLSLAYVFIRSLSDLITSSIVGIR